MQDSTVVDALAAHVTELRMQQLEIRLCLDVILPNICHLQRLETLILGPSQHYTTPVASSLGGEIARLQKLRHLELRGGRFSSVEVTARLSQLQQLTHLSLRAVSNDPMAAICQLPSLQELSLGGRSVAWHVPEHFLGLRELTRMTLHNVNLYGCQGLSALTSLRSLKAVRPAAAGDPTADFMLGVGKLYSLTHLHLIWSDMGAFSCAAIGGLSHLQCLTFEANLTQFECSNGWTALTQLRLSHNLLDRLPSNLTALSALCELDVSVQSRRFQLPDPLDFMRHMPALQSVDLSQDLDDVLHTWAPGSLLRLVQAEEWIFRLQGRTIELLY